MVSKDVVQEKEESIRKMVRELPDNRRIAFFKESEKRIKDPDTYATLNYVFFTGFHHFYLGKLGRGLFNIVLYLVGFFMLFNNFTGVGIIIIITISIFEFYELFNSQTIVQEHNNDIMEEIYHHINKV